jgi:hypothetical protein
MNITTQIKNCKSFIKVVIKMHFIPNISQHNVQKTNNANNITKSVSYHNVYKPFNVEKHMDDEKKYITKMVKYYNS